MTTLTANRCSQVLKDDSPRNVPELLPDADEDILRQLVHVPAARHPSHETVHLRQMCAIELLERTHVPSRGTRHVGLRLSGRDGLQIGVQCECLQAPSLHQLGWIQRPKGWKGLSAECR